VARLKSEGGAGVNASSTSVDSSSSRPDRPSRERKRKGPPSPPEFDFSAALMLAATTKEKLEGMDVKELEGHVEALKREVERGGIVHKYWTEKKEGAEREKEAFEGVIENLIGFARKVRK
jgi:hypothetical protein